MKRPKTRRLLSLFLCVMLLFTLPLGVIAQELPAETPDLAADAELTLELWANPFTDVAEADWFFPAVQYVCTSEIFTGVGADSFAPQTPMTRGMFVTALGRLHRAEMPEDPGTSTFQDVAADQYYAPYVEWAVANQIVAGTGNGNFEPDQYVTREAMAATLSRYCAAFEISLEAEKETVAFMDAAEISAWAQVAVLQMQTAGIIQGVPVEAGVKFEPLRASSRAEVAALFSAFDQFLADAVPEPTFDGHVIVQEYLQLLLDEKYAESESFLDATMQDALASMGGIQAVMQSLTVQFGQLQAVQRALIAGAQEPYTMYRVGITGVNGGIILNAMVTLDQTGKIAGLQFQPVVEAAITMPAGFVENKITVDAGTGFPLEGYLVKPEQSTGPVPAVVLIQGSGATNYDETVGANRIFGKIAKGLAEQGIATLRYDKRNYAYPEITTKKGYSIEEEYVEDVLTAVNLLQQEEGIDPEQVFILGHSQGGMLAPLFLDRGAEAKGMILLAGTPKNLMDILDEQQAYLLAEYANQPEMAEYVAEYQKMQEEWKKQRKALEGMTAEEALEAGTVYEMAAYYMFVLNQVDAIGTIKKLEKPTLIMQGSKDWQVYPDKDYALYEKELADQDYVSFKLYEGLSHLFTPSAAENLSAAMAEYNVPMEIPEQVFVDIAKWIADQV